MNKIKNKINAHTEKVNQSAKNVVVVPYVNHLGVIQQQYQNTIIIV
jgi:hypothetical protein